MDREEAKKYGVFIFPESPEEPPGSPPKDLIEPPGSQPREPTGPPGSPPKAPIEPSGRPPKAPIEPLGSSSWDSIEPPGSPPKALIEIAGSSPEVPIELPDRPPKPSIEPPGSPLKAPIELPGSPLRESVHPPSSAQQLGNPTKDLNQPSTKARRKYVRKERTRTPILSLSVQRMKPNTSRLSNSHTKFGTIIFESFDKDCFQDTPGIQKLHNLLYNCASQVESFRHQGLKYIVRNWLNVARVHRIRAAHKKRPAEVLRLPQRRIEYRPDIITNIKVSYPYLVISHCWGHPSNPYSTYVTVHHLPGTEEPVDFFYSDNISDLNCDSSYIYVRLKSNLVYIHRRDCFQIYNIIDFNEIHLSNISGIIVDPNLSNRERFTNLTCIATTQHQLIITSYTIFEHRTLSSYNFDNSMSIISLKKIDDLIIILRTTHEDATSPQYTSIDFGFLAEVIPERFEFAHECCLKTEGRAINMNYVKEKDDPGHLFLLLFHPSFSIVEIVCIYLPKLEIVWTTYYDGVINGKAYITAFSYDHVILTKAPMKTHDIRFRKAPTKKSKLFCKRCKIHMYKATDLALHKQLNHRRFDFMMNEYTRSQGFTTFKKFSQIEEK